MTAHSQIALKSRPAFGEREKQPFVDVDYVAVQEPSGPCATKTVEFRRGQKLSAYELEVAERHGIALRWK
jgi:hypothetical protein